MKTDLFWQGLACVALVAALGVAVMHVSSARPVRAEAAGNIIAETASENGLHRLFLIDTSRKVILVYGGRNQYDFTMLAGRYFDYDAQATVNNEWTFKQNGYPAKQMQIYVSSKTGTK